MKRWPAKTLIILLCTFSNVSAKVPDKATYQSFYNLVESVREDSIASRIDSLREFILKHPYFSDAYALLLNWYTYHGQFDAGKNFFLGLANEPGSAQNAYWMLANIYQVEKDKTKALAAFEKALTSNSPPIRLLYDFIEFDHYYFEQAKGAAILRALDLGENLNRLIEVFYAYYRLDSDYKKIIDILNSLPPTLTNENMVLDVWGTAYHFTSDTSQVRSKWKLGYQLAQQRYDRRAEARFLINLGFFEHQVKGNYDKATAYYDAAYAIALNIQDYNLLQYILGFKGYMFRDMGENSESEKIFKEAITICLKLQSPRSLADWYKGIGITLYTMGRYTAAFDSLQQAKEVAIASNNIYYILSALFDSADLYVKLKLLDLAKRELQEASQVATAKEKIYEIEAAQAKLGQVLLEEKKYAEARTLFEGFLDFLNKTPTYSKESYQWQGNIAEIYFQEGDFENARKHFSAASQAAKEIDAISFEGFYQLRLGNIAVRLAQGGVAAEHFDSAFTIASEKEITELLWQIYFGYGNLYKLANNLELAIKSYQDAAQIVESTRNQLTVDQFRIGYFAESHRVYQELVNCYRTLYEQVPDANYLDSIIIYYSLGQSRALLDLQNRPEKIAYSDEYTETVHELRSLQRALREKSIHSAEGLDSLKNRLRTTRLTLIAQRLHQFTHEQLKNDAAQFSPPTLAEIKNYLSINNSGLLLYHLSEETPFVMAISGTESQIIDLQTSPAALKAAIDTLISPFHYVQLKNFKKQPIFRADIAHQLYNKLFQPIIGRLNLPRKLIVVPDMPIATLPLDMLLTLPAIQGKYTPSDFPDYAEKFLLKDYTITNCPSIMLLGNMDLISPVEPSMAVLSNPTYGINNVRDSLTDQRSNRNGWFFEPLLYARAEAKEIQRIYPRAKIFQDSTATKTVLQQEIFSNDITHIASHGFADSIFAAFSGLALSLENDSLDDGLLMGYEIMDWRLNSDLITLSACETGRGRLAPGEGILGLPRLLLAAGARSVLVSHWRVNDKFTSELMPAFYKAHLVDKLSKGEALNRAKKEMIESKPENGSSIYHQHPFFWAPFSLYGDSGLVMPKKSGSWITLFWGIIFILAILIVWKVSDRKNLKLF